MAKTPRTTVKFLADVFLLLPIITLAFPDFAASDILEELDNCAKVRDPASRLNCYDLVQKTYDKPVARGLWKLKTKIFPDQSRHVYLTLRANRPIETAPQAYTPTLGLRCKDEKTVVYVVPGVTPKVDHGGDGVTVSLRFDDEKPKEQVFVCKPTKVQPLFAQSSINLIDALLKHRALSFQFTPLDALPVTATFTLSGLDSVIDEIRRACHREE